MDKIKIAMLGMGTVGTGTWNTLQTNKEAISHRTGYDVEICRVLVRDKSKRRYAEVPDHLITDNPEDIFQDDSIQIVVELMGGIEPAKTYILRAIENRKHVVTANKALISQYGDVILEAAEKYNVSVKFEASVCGGIPIINTLTESMISNEIQELVGIVNGTTNYILSRMTQSKLDFDAALKEAQEKGYAEADPTSDIEAFDAMYKLMILSDLSFHTKIREKDIYREGITKITSNDIEYARELGYAIKLLAIAKDVENQLELRVHPALIPLSSPLAYVNDAYNAVFLRGNIVGELMLYGKGAGASPTGSAVTSDILSIIQYEIKSQHCVYKPEYTNLKTIKPVSEIRSTYYIRLIAKELPGVMGKITTLFGNHKVSLASVIQKDSGTEFVPIVFVTHETTEGDVLKAMENILQLPEVHALGNLIRVENL